MKHQYLHSDIRLAAWRLIALLSLLLLVIGRGVALAQNPAYNFALQLGDAGEDIGNAIATDASGNIYVTGIFNDTVDFDPGAGTVNLTAIDIGDAFVASYDPSGNYRWAFRVGGIQPGNVNANEGRSIAVDGSGNVVVSGIFSGTADFDPGPAAAIRTAASGLWDMFVARYTPTGNYIWAFQIAGAGSQALAIDGSGAIVVTGEFNGTVDFDPGSNSATLSAANAGGTIYIARYTTSGTYLWAFKIDGGSGPKNVSNTLFATSLATDGSDNIYVAGFFTGTINFNPGGKGSLTSAGNRDLFVARYSPAGKYSWAFRAGGSGNDVCNSLAADGSGNISLTGAFEGTVDFNPGTGTANQVATGGTDIFVARYNVSGAYQWALRAGSTGSDEGRAVATDGSGNVYVSGGYSGTVDFDPGSGTASLDAGGMFIARYSGSGSYDWISGITGSGIGANRGGRTLATNGNGTLYTTGWFRSTLDFDPGSGTAALTSAGDRDMFIAVYTEAMQPKRSFDMSAETIDNGGELQAVPNPFTSEFTVRYDGRSGPSQIQIVDMMGRIVETRYPGAAGQEMRLGSDLPAGTYFVQMTQGETSRTMIVRKIK